MLIVLTTTPQIEEAEALAEKIVAARLAACVQILGQMKSLYLWEGEIQKENEHLLFIKTISGKYEELRDFITANHSYSIPEIVAIESKYVSEDYRQWMTTLLS